MNATFDYFNRKQTPALLLCNPYLEPVASLGASFNIQNTLRYNALSELEFDFPQSSDNGSTKFSAYSKIQIKMVVLVDGVGYYIITECPEETEGSIPVKHVVCQSLESELMYRRMVGLNGTFNFYNDEAPYGTLMDTIVKSSQGWTLDYVDPDLMDVYRTFDTNNMTLYNFMMSEMEKAFSCVFTFDTLNKKISAYSIANLNDEVNVYLSFQNINKSVELTQYSDEIATVLYCYGDGSVDVRGVNPLGTNAIYNFEYYMNSNWMSNDLIQAIQNWDNRVDGLQETSASYTTQRNLFLTTLVGKRNEYADLKIALSSYQTELEAYRAMPVPISACIVDLENKIKNQKVELKKKSREIYQAQNNMDNKNADLLKIANQLKFTGQFCWQGFVGNISSSISKITNITKNWRGVYYVGAELDDAQYYAFIDDIGRALYNASTQLSKLLLLAKSNTKNYFSLSDNDVIVVRNYLYNCIEYIQESYDLFFDLIPYTSITNQLSALIVLLTAYIDIIDYPTNFTQEQYIKLQSFMFENTYTNKNVVITDIMNERQIQRETQSLYDQAEAVLSRVSTPRYEFTGDFINFLSLPEYQDFINELDLGKIVTIELGSGEKVKAALLEVVYTYDNPTEFELVFSNRVKLNNSNFKFADLFIETTNDAIGLSGVGGGTTYQTTNNTSILNPYTGNNNFQSPTSLNNFLSVAENEDEEEPAPATTLNNSNLLSLDNAMISKLGYISFGVEPPSFYGNNVGAWLGFDSVAKISLYSSETDYLQWDGYRLLIQARNFTLDSSGNITASSASLAGKISSYEGDIGGWTIAPTSLTSGSENNFVSLNSSGSNPSFSAGSVVLETAPFRVYPDGRLVATSASISGAITATSGCIGGWKVGSTSLYAGTGVNAVGMETSSGCPALYAGNESGHSAPFKVYPDGSMYGTSGSIGGNRLATDSVSSSSFTSGVLGSGWRITSTGDAEFQNLIARGMIKTSVFQKDTISAVNGIVLISKSDVLAFDMTALDSATLTVTGSGTAFVANEIIRMKDGTNDEWLRITSASAAPTYHVVRDVIVPRTYAVNNNPAWKKGTTVASLGVGAGTKTGYIVLDSSSTNSPYIDVYGRNTIDISASGTTLHGRYGYLGGISDGDVGLDSTDVWGLYTDNAYIKGTVVANSGSIGGWKINNNSISSAGISIVSGTSPCLVFGNSSTGYLTGSGIWMGKTPTGDYGFYMGTSASYLAWSGSQLALNNVSLNLSGSSPYIAIGNPPPTSSTFGCGIFINNTGLYSLKNNGYQIKIDALTGTLYTANGDINMSDSGINLSTTARAINFYEGESGSKIGYLYSNLDTSGSAYYLGLFSGEQSSNIVPNGDFSQGDTGWAYTTGGTGILSINTQSTKFHSPSLALGFIYMAGGGGSNGSAISDSFTILPNKKYTYSSWWGDYVFSGYPLISTTVYLQEFDVSNTLLTQTTLLYRGTGHSSRNQEFSISGSLLTNPSTSYGKIYIYSEDKDGSSNTIIAIDDISLSPLSDVNSQFVLYKDKTILSSASTIITGSVTILGDVNINSLIYTKSSMVTGFKVGIAQQNPSYGLDVNGTFRASNTAYFDSNVIFNSSLTLGGNAISYLDYGTYSPTLTYDTNITSASIAGFTYSRVGNMVMVAGRLRIDTTGTGPGVLGISLPVSSNFANAYNAWGSAITEYDRTSGFISASVAGDIAQLDFYANVATAQYWWANFSYRVI